ncbi:hypothetical protein Syun_011139 [Stephania yunnanensis]|uniref:Auxin-responsive protein n=1 Tax=Stephania yunnanensis TaxID=152371 RepID=A0AAP0JXP9_9MAGN
MELELALSLSPAPMGTTRPFDLNCCAFESKETSECGVVGCKRGFHEAFVEDPKLGVKETLPLLQWNDKPNGEDEQKSPMKSTYSINQSDHGEGNGIVGWPPIKSWRKKHQNHQQQNQIGVRCRENRREVCGMNDMVIHHKSMHVKVKMEGEAIGRKVDISLHSSYQSLVATLRDMFGKCQIDMNNGHKDGTGYTLAYQDKEGDWLLVGDVPWQTFIQSVQRLKIQRNGN